ncbi:MAG: lipoate--protein ligase [Bacteroidota bacterium]|nr:lipoate--protein ligase [Bacteroidota bacterium]
MKCIISKISDPYFNLASEEYLLKNRNEDFFLLYRNEPSIIIGKHQNAFAEINWDFVIKHKIKVARRLSGGGTVYHDRGNLNFAFIRKGLEGKLVDFKKYTAPIQEALDKMGIETKFEGYNSLNLNGLKVSGNAEHVFKKRVLHHGTLLFSTDLANLEEAISISPGQYSDKAVKSVRAKVTNISESLENKLTIEEFESGVMHYFRESDPGSETYVFDRKEIQQINRLKAQKYETWRWIFSYSPKYKFSKTIELNKGSLEVKIDVDKGIIENANISGSILLSEKLKELEALLPGLYHKPDQILGAWEKATGQITFSQKEMNTILSAFF